MATADWSPVSGGLSSPSLLQGVAAGLTPPPGGGSFVYGFRAGDDAVGGAALYANSAGPPSFGPIGQVGGVQMGGSIRGAMQRRSAGVTGFSPFLYLCLQSLSFASMAYMIGLSDAIPSRIVVVKGLLLPTGNVTLPGVPVGQQGVLGASSATFNPGTWVQLRLDAIANANGDVVLNAYFNDLTVGGASVATPSWAAIPGIPQIIDDSLGINTGSVPLAGLTGNNGYIGFGCTKTIPNAIVLFDQVEPVAQTG